MLKGKNYADDIERLEHHVHEKKDSNVFENTLKRNEAISDLSSVLKHNSKNGNFAIMELVIDTSQFSIGFMENTRNWPQFVKKWKALLKTCNL